MFDSILSCVTSTISRREEGDDEIRSSFREVEDGKNWATKKNIISFHCMGVSKNSDTPKSSILIGFSIINHPFWGIPIFGNTHIDCLINGILIIVHYKFPV